jgi:hypothetical protein
MCYSRSDRQQRADQSHDRKYIKYGLPSCGPFFDLNPQSSEIGCSRKGYLAPIHFIDPWSQATKYTFDLSDIRSNVSDV